MHSAGQNPPTLVRLHAREGIVGLRSGLSPASYAGARWFDPSPHDLKDLRTGAKRCQESGPASPWWPSRHGQECGVAYRLGPQAA